MSAINIIVRHGSDLADYDSDKIKEMFVEQAGRGFSFRNTAKFFEHHTIKGAEQWSAQEKNLFVHCLQDNLYKEKIIDKYNDLSDSGEKISDKLKTFKNLFSINQFLKAAQYKNPDFAQKVNEKIIEWGYTDNFENMKTLKKALHLYLDTHSILGLLSSSSLKVKDAFEHIEAQESIQKQKESSLFRTSMVALASMALFNYINPTASMTASAISKIGSVVGSNPAILTVVGAVVASYAIYKTFGAVNKLVTSVVDKRREKKIEQIQPSTWTERTFQRHLSHHILGYHLMDNRFDLKNSLNLDYLAMSAFVNEKAYRPGIQMSQSLARRLKLTPSQEEKINRLSLADIHEASKIYSPQLRQNFYLNGLSDAEKIVFKKLSNLQEMEKFKPMAGRHFAHPVIDNAGPDLKQSVDALRPYEQDLVLSYLALRTKNGVCSKQTLSFVSEAVSAGSNQMIEILSAQLDIDYDNKKKSPAKDLELEFVKKFYHHLVNKDNVGLNPQMRQTFKEIGQDYAFHNTELMSFENAPLMEKIYRHVPGTVESAELKNRIHRLRQKSPLCTDQSLPTVPYLAKPH